ncbi:MAG: nucleotidyltransferase domain-containing protein [Planctomycetota bacterium]|jgi:predicted nucleotidyltransferase|nr:nucleotidyltransferase domain-containing protein [Planctomycetota bacterium]
MNGDDNHGLSAAQLALMRKILAASAARIARVDLFGSRAQGTHRPNSDIDLALHGDLTAREIAGLAGQFQESSMPVAVDVVAYERVQSAPLKAHIDRVAKTLFNREQLTAILAE